MVGLLLTVTQTEILLKTVKNENMQDANKLFKEVKTQDNSRALEAAQFYEDHADAIDEPWMFKRRTKEMMGDGFPWEECIAYCGVHNLPHNSLRFSHSKFHRFVAGHFGVTLQEMREQWRNVKYKDNGKQ